MDASTDRIAGYLDSLGWLPPRPPGPGELKELERIGLFEYIFQRVTSSEFRRSRLDPETAEDVGKKIQAHLTDGTAISFSIPFGAYKHWRTWSYPEPDWAEVFNLNYMLRYVDPIAAVYPPGVALHYSYGDFVMDIVSNMPRSDTERYVTHVKALIRLFAEHTRSNILLNSVCINEFYSAEEHMDELRRHYEDNVLNWARKYSEQDRMNKVTSALRNLMPKGIEDLTCLSPEDWHNRALASAMWCDAHDSLSRRRGFNKYSGHIQLGNIRGRRLELHVGSCETSVHQFWVGVGLLEARGNRFLPRIVSQDKLDAMRGDFAGRQNHTRIWRVPVETRFATVSSNYAVIDLFEVSEGLSVTGS